VAIAAAMTGTLLATAAPAQARPEPYSEAWVFVVPVFDEDLTGALFLNTTREAFCTPEQVAFEAALTEWLQTPEEERDDMAPEPPQMEPSGLVPLTGRRNELRPGDETQPPVVVLHASASGLPAEFWAFDPGIVDEDTLGVGPCLDTDQANTRLATGTGDWRIGTNNEFGSPTRAAAFGDTVRISLQGAGGTFVYKANFRNRLTPGGEYKSSGGDAVMARR
jgi:hypothetical protein